MSFNKLPSSLLKYYEDLSQELGIGGFAKVLLARHIKTGVKVAVKVISKNNLKNESVYIENEISTLKKMNHQYICKLYQVYEDSSDYYLIMEYIPGGELYDEIISRQYISEGEARRIFRQVLSAVGYMHSKGVAHRDLKPENILLDDLKNIRIIDFGLSANPKGGLINPLETLCGSVAYAAPELLSGLPYHGNEVDVWSIGVLLFTLLCGYLPFENTTNIRAVLENMQRGIFSTASHVSNEAKNLLKQMLEPDPKKRTSVWELAQHKWVVMGYGCPVNWGALSDIPPINNAHVDILSEIYSETKTQILNMICNNAFNEITAHYQFLALQDTYVGLIYPGSLSSQKSLSRLNERIDNSTTTNKSNNKKHEQENINPFSNKGSVDLFNPDIIKMQQNNTDFIKKLSDSSIVTKIPIPFKRKFETESKEENSDKIMKSNDVDTQSSTSIADTSSTSMSTPSTSSKQRLFGKIVEFFTPHKYQPPDTSPRLHKPAGNIRIVQLPSINILQTITESVLMDLKREGYLYSIKLDNFTSKCERIYSKRNRLIFSMEICHISTNPSNEMGILSKRMKGDSWEYKQAIEYVMERILTASQKKNMEIS